MTPISGHRTTQRQFEEALVAAIRASGLTPRQFVVRCGKGMHDRMNGEGENRGYTALRGVGFVALEVDEAMDDWSCVVAPNSSQGPWNNPTLNEWRCPKCADTHYDEYDLERVLCGDCDEPMERLYPMDAEIGGREGA